MTASGLPDDHVRLAAWRDARTAAKMAQVQVRPLLGADVEIAQDVIRQAWGPQQVPQNNLLRALAHAGSTLIAATRAGRPLGVVMGFLGWTGGLHVHSHMTAVVADEQSRGVGYALKLWQRAECLDSGISEVRWTFDPLIARNAYFNLVKLGVDVIAFRPDFYGSMDDIVNAGDTSDRFEVSWALSSARVADAVAGRRRVLSPVTRALAVPPDYDLLRRTDPERARALRRSWRADLQRLLVSGAAVEWADGGYSIGDASSRPPAEALIERRRG